MAAGYTGTSHNGEYSAKLERIKPCLMRSNGFLLSVVRCFTQRGLIRNGLTSLCEAPLYFLFEKLNTYFTFFTFHFEDFTFQNHFCFISFGILLF